MRVFTAICSVGEKRQIDQFQAADEKQALEKWLALTKSRERSIFLPLHLNEFERDIVDNIIEPITFDGITGVWGCSDVVSDQLIDLLLVDMSSSID